VCRRSRGGFTSRDEIWARSPDCVLYDVGDEQGKDHGDEPAEECDVGFMGAGAQEEGPED
jgi:hypothetical protein